MMRRLAVRLSLVLVLACLGANAQAQERILSFDSEVSIGADGALDVVETIVVRAEGTNIRRGIYRDFPTRYRDRNGMRFTVDLGVVSLQRNGAPEPYFTEALGNGVRINFGNDSFLPVPGEFSYVLRYRTTRQIGFFDEHDELYWNVTGNDWAFPIERASARVQLPGPVPAARLRTDAYTGATGSKDDATTLQVNDGGATWDLATPLMPGEGMTVVLGLPKGIVQPPSRSEKLRWMLRDAAFPIVTATALAALLGFYLWLWRRIGRDPASGTIIARYEPPDGHSAAGLRYVRRMGYDPVCFSVDAVALGVAGFLRISSEKKFLSDQWSLERNASGIDASALRHDSERALANALFSGGKNVISLDSANAVQLRSAKSAHEAALDRQYQPRYFKLNRGWSVAGFGFTVFVTFLTFSLAVADEFAQVVALFGGVLMAITSIVFAFLLPRPSEEGQALRDHIQGLRLYLGVAERDDIARLTSPEPQLNAERYQQLLPYALALDVEAAWTARFTAAVGAAVAAEAARSASWIGGNAASIGSFTALGSSLGSSFSSQIASSTSPPGSRSGGGGGGSSGGGGGGGGGGGR